jgi:hypothetical protein
MLPIVFWKEAAPFPSFNLFQRSVACTFRAPAFETSDTTSRDRTARLSVPVAVGARQSTRASLLRHSFRSAPKAKARVQLWILPFSIHGWTRPAAKAAAGKTDGQTDRGRRTIIPKHALRSPRLVDHEGVACSRRRRPVSSLRTPRFSLQLCPRHEQAPPSASRDM